jgi:polyhydroxyalkanoate synthesis repressor PhaR
MATTEPPAAPGPGPVPITRYPNRRLYDRSRGRYVTLAEVAEMVRGGRSVTVRDSKTEEDLTRVVLTQIILDCCPERMEMFPVAVLNALIRANDAVLGLLREHFRQSLAFLEVLQQPAAAGQFFLPAPWLRPWWPAPAAPAPPAPPPGPDTAALLARVADLERRLDELRADAAPRGGRPGRQGRRRKPPDE